MASFTTSAASVFEGGASTSTKIVGRNENNSFSGFGTQIPLRFQITSDPNSHLNAGASSSYAGGVTQSNVGGYLRFSGQANLVLLPNTTYYLWIFPAVDTYGFYYIQEAQKGTVTTSGGAGLVSIRASSGWKSCLCYVYTASGWKLMLPYVYTSRGWVLH